MSVSEEAFPQHLNSVADAVIQLPLIAGEGFEPPTFGL
jgi:hypothetical protein